MREKTLSRAMLLFCIFSKRTRTRTLCARVSAYIFTFNIPSRSMDRVLPDAELAILTVAPAPRRIVARSEAKPYA